MFKGILALRLLAGFDSRLGHQRIDKRIQHSAERRGK